MVGVEGCWGGWCYRWVGGGAGAGASGGGLVLLSISPNFSVGSTCIGLTPRIWQGDGTAGIKVALTHLDNLPRPIAPGKAYVRSDIGPGKTNVRFLTVNTCSLPSGTRAAASRRAAAPQLSPPSVVHARLVRLCSPVGVLHP